MKIRDGQIDVAIVAGPRVKEWPTQGARVLSRHCADAGLKVGWYGGNGLKVRGVLPREASGAVVMVEDAQNRLHRIEAKAVVKIDPLLEFPLPFQGWYSPGLIPESTARKLMAQGSLSWQNIVVVLGTGNHALRLACELLENGLSTKVICLESVFDEVQGWEVERRRFETNGGKVLFGKPISLSQKTPFSFQLKVQDEHGTRVIDTARVISVGPFETDCGFREYPAGSLLIEWENTESSRLPEDVERILLDEHRAVVLASRIIKGLADVPAEFRNQFEKQVWQAIQKLREMESLPEMRFRWEYDGKWLSAESKKKLEEFGGVPKKLEPGRIVASIECIERIGCRVCEKSCPTGAIQIDRPMNQFLVEDMCSGCGFCLQACPSQVPVLFEGDTTESFTTVIFPHFEKTDLKAGDKVGLLSRKGEMLSQGRVLDEFLSGEVRLYKVEVPSHLAWEARSIVPMVAKAEVENPDHFYQEIGTRVEVQIQGDTRRVREGQNVSVSLFEIGMARPNDVLACGDGSCGLCQIDVDGVKKFACETTIHRGMDIKFTREHTPSSELCPCESVTIEKFKSVTEATNPESMEALTSVCDVARGKCHGLLCKKSWVKLAAEAGVNTRNYSDWRFPWVDWMFRD